MSTKTEITITVSGRAGTGKSAVLSLIEEALFIHGVAFRHEDSEKWASDLQQSQPWKVRLRTAKPQVCLVEKKIPKPIAPPPSTLRRIQVKFGDIWEETTMMELEVDQTFRMFEADGSLVKDPSGNTEWVVRSAPYINTEGVPSIEIVQTE